MRNRFQTVHVVLHYIGLILIILGVLMLLPLLFVVFSGEITKGQDTLYAFIAPSALSFMLGFGCKKFFREGHPYTLRSILICSLGWAACSAIGAIPYVMAIGAGYLDAYFETMSGFTTTGITMLSGLDEMPKSLLFWRSLTQWLGGVGILGFFLAVGHRGGGAHKLFGAESHKIGVERPVPGLHNTIKIIWSVYVGFTFFVFITLLVVDVPPFDCLCHSLTTLATGGFSTHDASIEFYRLSGYSNYVIIEYIIIIGMLMGGINFLIHYRVLTGRIKSLISSTEMKYFWGIIGICTALILAERYFKTIYPSDVSFPSPDFWKKVEENIRIALFQVVSILTTTGFATRSITSSFFGSTARQLFLILMVIGGCVGSTAGGFKVLRTVILLRLVKRELFRLRAPRQATFTLIIDGDPVPLDEVQRVSSIFYVWIALVILGGTVTAFLSNHGSLSSFSGMFSALGNIGPCYIPASEMSRLNPLIKVVYIFGMLAGRLEILPVLMLLNPRAWKY